jgi:peptide deformylase
MTILNILKYPDDRLRTIATPVDEVTTEITRFVDNMFETMYNAPGIGLAATQVDFHKEIIVIDLSEAKSSPLTLINPKILEKDGLQHLDEGCLSVPGIYEPIDRAQHIKVTALNKQGEVFELEAEDLLAVCIQHEMDHLKGKVFVDYLSNLKQQRIRKKLIKQKKIVM